MPSAKILIFGYSVFDAAAWNDRIVAVGGNRTVRDDGTYTAVP